MAVFISVSTNAFEEVFAGAQAGRPQARNMSIRRPLRGIEIKEDTYAVVKVIDSLGNELPLINSSSATEVDGVGQANHYANFILVGVTEQRAEKQQIVETFGEDYIFFFGEQPRILNFNAVVINTQDFNWKSEFWENYEKTFRGTRLLEKNARLYVYFDDVVVEGYMLNAQQVGRAENPYHLPLTFSLFVTNYAFLSNVGSVFVPPREAEAIQRAKDNPPYRDITEEEFLDPGGFAAPPDGTTNTGASGVTKKVSQKGGGSLTGFLASASEFTQDATFSIQSTLETVKNTFFSRRIVVPDGIGNQLALPPIDNLAKFQKGTRGLPIHQQRDEYVESEGSKPEFDRDELTRVKKELSLRDPKEMEEEARRQLKARGIDVTRPSTNYLLLGRAAFAGLQVVGSFGIRQADGALNTTSQT